MSELSTKVFDVLVRRDHAALGAPHEDTDMDEWCAGMGKVLRQQEKNVQELLDRIDHLEFENAALRLRVAELERPPETRTTT